MSGSKRKAQFELQKLLVEAPDAKARSSSQSLEVFLSRWLELAASRLSATTLRTYPARLRQLILPALGATPLDELTPVMIDRTYRGLLAGGTTYYILRQAHVALRSALGQAVKWEMLERNPASLVSLPPAPEGRIVSPSVEQLATILHDAEALHPQ